MQEMQETQEDPLEEEMATHYSILTWRIPWTEDPGRLQSIGLQRVRHNWARILNYIESRTRSVLKKKKKLLQVSASPLAYMGWLRGGCGIQMIWSDFQCRPYSSLNPAPNSDSTHNWGDVLDSVRQGGEANHLIMSENQQDIPHPTQSKLLSQATS